MMPPRRPPPSRYPAGVEAGDRSSLSPIPPCSGLVPPALAAVPADRRVAAVRPSRPERLGPRWRPRLVSRCRRVRPVQRRPAPFPPSRWSDPLPWGRRPMGRTPAAPVAGLPSDPRQRPDGPHQPAAVGRFPGPAVDRSTRRSPAVRPGWSHDRRSRPQSSLVARLPDLRPFPARLWDPPRRAGRRRRARRAERVALDLRGSAAEPGASMVTPRSDRRRPHVGREALAALFLRLLGCLAALAGTGRRWFG